MQGQGSFASSLLQLTEESGVNNGAAGGRRDAVTITPAFAPSTQPEMERVPWPASRAAGLNDERTGTEVGATLGGLVDDAEPASLHSHHPPSAALKPTNPMAAARRMRCYAIASHFMNC